MIHNPLEIIIDLPIGFPINNIISLSHNPRTNFGVILKCPTWDIIPRFPFVSMKDDSRLSWNLQNADLRAREEENGLYIMEYSG